MVVKGIKKITNKNIEDGELITKKDFLTHKEATEFWYLTNTCEWTYGGIWHSGMDTYSGQKESRFFRPFDVNVFVQTDLWARLKNLFQNKLILGKSYINYSDHASVNLPHCDGDAAGPTIMICLNQEWKKVWGGYTVLFESMNSNNVTHTVVPEPGKVAIFNGGVWHSGVPIAHFADYPRFMLTLHCSLDKGETN